MHPSDGREHDNHIQASLDDPSVIVIPQDVLLRKIHFLLSVAESRSAEESPLYPFYSTIFMTHSYTVSDLNDLWEFTSQSQAVLNPQLPRGTRRTPDESSVFYQWAPKAGELKTAIPYLGVMKEIKICVVKTYATKAGHVEAGLKFSKSIPQLSEQAFYAFHCYTQLDFVAIFFLSGTYFSLLRYERPTNLFPLPRLSNPNEPAPPALTVFTPPRKQKRKAVTDPDSDSDNSPPPEPDDNVIKYPAQHPQVLYYNELAVVEDSSGQQLLSPLFRAALRCATEMTAPPDAKLHFQASVFEPDLVTTLPQAMLEEGEAAIDRVYEANWQQRKDNHYATTVYVKTPMSKKPESLGYRPPGQRKRHREERIL